MLFAFVGKKMNVLLGETAFGRLLIVVTGGRFLKSTSIDYRFAAADSSGSDGKQSSTQLLVDWAGPDDPGIPSNWPLATKILVLVDVLIVNLSFYTAPGIYSASVPSIQSAFGVSEEVGRLGLSLFVIAYGIGPLIVSDSADIPSLLQFKE